jgi:hypothetical protein
MARVTNSEVRAILTPGESAALSNDQIDLAIDAAHIIVNGFQDAPCHTEESLTKVELYLSADLATSTTGGGTVEQEKIGDASEKRAMSADGQSQYWRYATMLDCSNQLIETGKRSAGLYSIGSHSADNTRDD